MASSSLTAKTKTIFSKVRKWVRENRLKAFFIILILAVGALLRLYRISEYMTFLGDEGRDVIIVRRLLADFDLILIGPRTSIGDMYLGPLYYYLMAPALLLANFSPVGPAVMIALLGVATIFFVWWVAREWFGDFAALVAASLYAISPIVIIYSRSSWNPNIMPFFSLLSIYSIWNVWRKQRFGWLIVTGIAMAFVLQSHYLGLLLVPTLGFFWFLSLVEAHRTPNIDHRTQLRHFIKHSIIGAGIFALLMSPLVIFDARHGWRNFASMKEFFTVRQTTVSARPWTALPEMPDVVPEAVGRVVTGKNEFYGKWLGVFLAGGLGVALLKLVKELKEKVKGKAGVPLLVKRTAKTIRKSSTSPYFLLFVWLLVAFIGLGVYKQEIYDHYYGFFFAAPFILLGGIVGDIVNQARKLQFPVRIASYILVGLGLLILVSANLEENPLRYPPNRQLQRSVEVSNKIIEEAGSDEFNLAVIAERNYEGAYQYYLERWNAPVVMIDPQRYEETAAKQLFVVCELPEEECDPVNSSKTEIAAFGWSRIEEKWQVAGVTLYKLVPNP